MLDSVYDWNEKKNPIKLTITIWFIAFLAHKTCVCISTSIFTPDCFSHPRQK